MSVLPSGAYLIDMPKETIHNTRDTLVGRLVEHPQMGIGLITDYTVYPSNGGYPTRRTYTVMWGAELGAIEMETSVIDECRVFDSPLHFPE